MPDCSPHNSSLTWILPYDILQKIVVDKIHSETDREDTIAREFRINERIRSREVLVIGESGEQLGTMPTLEAIRIAREKGVDLVEVSPTAVPPVCRLMDYGRFKYEQAKKERDSRKNHKPIEIREIRLRPKTNEHDIDTKSKVASKLLGEGDKVKVSVVFRGREMNHPDLAKGILARVVENLKDESNVEVGVMMEGRSMTVLLVPAAKKQRDS